MRAQDEDAAFSCSRVTEHHGGTIYPRDSREGAWGVCKKKHTKKKNDKGSGGGGGGGGVCVVAEQN
jgi:hypothetical protein